MSELIAAIKSIQRLEYVGNDSITRLLFLNYTALEFVEAALHRSSDEPAPELARDRERRLKNFELNGHSLSCIQILDPHNCRLAFLKIKDRLVQDVRFFLEREQSLTGMAPLAVRHKLPNLPSSL